MNKLIHGNSLEKLKELEDNSVDAVICDPPYELTSMTRPRPDLANYDNGKGNPFARKQVAMKGFMGKEWDGTGIAFNKDLWAECLRVLKPGGHLLAFSGTRTYHRMAVAIEDAGFEVRDMIEWVYGSGFPKSLNIGKSVNQLETNEWSKIGKALDNIDQKSIMEVWKSNSNNVKIVETQLLKNQIIVGQDTLSENFAVLNVVQNSNQKNLNLLVSFVEQNLNEAQAINTKTNTALQSVEAEIRQLQDNVNFAEKHSQNQNHKYWNIFTAQCDVKEWLNENTEVNHKVDEALKTLRGNKKYSNEEITNVLCVALTDILKLTILNQLKTFQNLGTNQKMECVSAINVIITEYTAENLISNTVAILKSKAVDKLQGNERETYLAPIAYPDSDCWGIPNNNIAGNNWGIVGADDSGKGKGLGKAGMTPRTKGTSEWEGWGTALKPAHEPICMARKPITEKNIAENVLKWGVGGINIDESRVGTETISIHNAPKGTFAGGKPDRGSDTKSYRDSIGRFPANLIHDGSDEVKECFPETKSGKLKSDCYEKDRENNSMFAGGENFTHKGYDADSGSASRFFKSILYYPKASKKERNMGCEELPDVKWWELNQGGGQELWKGQEDYRQGKKYENKPSKNYHPTVKPIALMEYLIKMVTPKGGIVLDPFMGSGSTGVAAKKNGYDFIGIDMTPEYVEIAKARINVTEIENKLI